MAISKKLLNRVEKYAELSIKKGINVQPGQTVTLYAVTEPDQIEFARMQAKAAYAEGAKQVNIEWRDPVAMRLFFDNASDDVITTVPDWEKAKWDDLVLNKKTSRLSTIGEDPDALSGVDPKRLSDRTKATNEAFSQVRVATMKDDISWLVNSAPTQAWADKVFPNLAGTQEAIDALWDAILTTVRVTEDNDPIKEWDDHINQLRDRAKFLNDHNFKELHYKNNKSEFTIGLAEGHIWEAAYSVDAAGNTFIPNMPTEEVFTAPDNRNLSGHVAATLPLTYQNNVIKDIELDLKDGRIVSASASQNEDVLKQLIETDEGSHSLGEVSLVPHSSPISQSGIVWFETLFDENASDHLAIGGAYNSNIKDGKTASPEDLAKKGWNRSDVHVDFMVGSADMNVDGETFDGEIVPIMRNGEWV